MRVPSLTWILLLAAAGGFAVARVARSLHEPPLTRATPLLRPPAPVARLLTDNPIVTLKEKGARLVPEVFAIVENAGLPRLRALALQLAADMRHRGDLAVWGPLLARWAELDGPGLIAFARQEAPPGLRGWLEDRAWFARGAAHPDAAFAAGRELPPHLRKHLIGGMVEKAPRAGAEAALKLPDAQFNLRTVLPRLAEVAPQVIAELMPRALYDGMREPLVREHLAILAKTDPAAAMAAARQAGAMFFDPVVTVTGEAAKTDPAQAAALVAEMPVSRSRALSSLALARSWGTQHPEAAAAWVRTSLTGIVRQSALLEIAAASGGPEPGRALALVAEAGWEISGDFHEVTGVDYPDEQSRQRLTPFGVGISLLKKLAAADPAAARDFVASQVPEQHRKSLSTGAGLKP